LSPISPTLTHETCGPSGPSFYSGGLALWVGVEVKKPKGSRIEDTQKRLREQWAPTGALCVIARSEALAVDGTATALQLNACRLAFSASSAAPSG
jgi:hypothetical protein